VATPARTVSLGLVLACLAGTLALGIVVKAPCASGGWTDGRQYERFCYSDIVPLLGTEQLTRGRLPYLDACDRRTAYQCDEYPVISMWTMRAAAWVSGSDVARFFWANVVLLALAAAIVTVAVYLMAGPRALWVALAPTMLIYAFVNWDLIAVAFATAATIAYLRRRDVWSGALLGLGAAAKIYPALLIVPFVAGRFRSGEPARGTYLTWAAIGSWLVVNVPFALAAPGGWWEFFRFNGQRPADWDSIWFIACHRATGDYSCGHTGVINVASAALFVALVVVFWRWKAIREPGFARWTLGFPVIVLFLLTNKVYSPQYGLWLLPWFALVLPGARLFIAFEIADVLVFLTRFSWFSELSGYGGLPIGSFEIAVVIRAIILALCLASWLRRREVIPEPVELEGPLATSGAAAPAPA
jgi:uncharacterized membrane protein